MELLEYDSYLRKIYAHEHDVNIKFIKESLFQKWVFKRLYIIEIASRETLKENEIYDMLNEIAIWYHKYSNTANADDILTSKDKIVTSLYFIGKSRSDYSNKLKQKQKQNKYNIDRFVTNCSKETKPTAAKALAHVEYNESLLEEAKIEAKLDSVEDIMKSFKEIVYSMSQRVAWIRQDRSHSTQL